MKKFFLRVLPVFLVAALSVGLASCGDDDDEVKPGEEAQQAASNSIIGTWRKYSADSQGAPTEELGNILWVFSADGTMLEQDIDDDMHVIEGHT